MMMMMMMMMMMSERRHVRDVLRGLFSSTSSLVETHTKKRKERFPVFVAMLLEDGCCSLRVCSEREREREMKMANWIDEKLHK